MVKLFVSYARIDIDKVEGIIDTLRQRYEHGNVWYDQELHNRGGENWWEQILDAISEADIFVYLLSKESVESAYCQAEFLEAQRLHKRFIFIQIRDKTPLPETISSKQYTDMSRSATDHKIWIGVYNSIDYQISQIPKRTPKPTLPNRTPRPSQTETETPRADDTPTRTTPKIELRAVEAPQGNSILIQILIGLFVTVVGGVILFFVINSLTTPTPDPTPTQVADNPTETNTPLPTVEETQEVRTTDTPTPTDTLTPTITTTPSPTDTPDVIAAAQQVIEQQTAQALIDQATATSARATQDESLRLTQNANLTATAILWTATPTPDFTQTVNAILTQWADETATAQANIEATETQQSNLNATATATLWTATPTPTLTPTATQTLTPLESALIRAQTFTGTLNADWQPFEHDFDGITMVLVPTGCFMMGSSDGGSDEQPVHEQCFDAPFWIDKYEVTQAQLDELGFANSNLFDGDNRPAEQITWFEANEFCQLRNSQLPTEREWEYVARGVESWIYPWGNEFIGDNVVYSSNSDNQTAEVGSHPNGVSWVGAMDMSGNVWEWVSSLYESYPYDAGDGREADTGERTDVFRVLRGGAFNFNTDDLRSADRNWVSPINANNFLGFRCLLFER